MEAAVNFLNTRDQNPKTAKAEYRKLLAQVTVEDAVGFLNMQLLRLNRILQQYTTSLKLYSSIYSDISQTLLDSVGARMPTFKELTVTVATADQYFSAVAAPVDLQQQLYLVRKEKPAASPLQSA